jgi:hypothetical protein
MNQAQEGRNGTRAKRRFAILLSAVVVFALASIAALLAIRALHGSSGAAVCGDADGPRWPVKTLSDASAGKVNYRPRRTSVSELVQVPAPPVTSTTARITGIEMTTYRVRVHLTKVDFVHSDRDLTGRIADPNNPGITMAIEFPDTRCTAASRSIKRREMARARATFAAACGSLERLVSVTAIVSGVGFFDVPPTRSEQPRNRIELHPVLEFVPLTKCQRGRLIGD